MLLYKLSQKLFTTDEAGCLYGVWGCPKSTSRFFWPILTPCHTLSHIPGPPKSTSHLGPPRILIGLVQKAWTKASCTNSLSIVRGGFCPGVFLSGRFCPGWFLSVSSSVRIHLLQQNVKHHFKFHVSYV